VAARRRSRCWLGRPLGRLRGLLTKTTGLVAFAVLFSAFLARLAVIERERHPWAYVRRGRVAMLLLGTSGAIALGPATSDWLSGHRAHLIIASADQSSPALIVGNHAKNYLWFDACNFVAQPFTSHTLATVLQTIVRATPGSSRTITLVALHRALRCLGRLARAALRIGASITDASARRRRFSSIVTSSSSD
jgi:hypothetical protein